MIMLISNGHLIGLMALLKCPARHGDSSLHERAGRHVRGTDASSIFMVRCSFLAMGAGNAYSTGHWYDVAEALETRDRWTRKAREHNIGTEKGEGGS